MSEVGLGGAFITARVNTEREDARRAVRRALDLGVNYLAPLTVTFSREARWGAFEEWLHSGGHARALGPESFEVAVLTHSRRRLENLCRVARDELERERWDAYLFATFDALDAEDAAGYGWTTLDGEEVPPLPDAVWPEEPDAGAAS